MHCHVFVQILQGVKSALRTRVTIYLYCGILDIS